MDALHRYGKISSAWPLLCKNLHQISNCDQHPSTWRKGSLLGTKHSVLSWVIFLALATNELVFKLLKPKCLSDIDKYVFWRLSWGHHLQQGLAIFFWDFGHFGNCSCPSLLQTNSCTELQFCIHPLNTIWETHKGNNATPRHTIDLACLPGPFKIDYVPAHLKFHRKCSFYWYYSISQPASSCSEWRLCPSPPTSLNNSPACNHY